MFMFEKAVVGGRRYWAWVLGLLVVIGVALAAYLRQLSAGLAVTGLSRDVSWGLYIGQFTFVGGIAASAVIVVLPYYLHDFKAFGRITILGQFLAIAAVTVCGLFIMADMGQPMRVFNMLRYPTPGSMMFWDMLTLGGFFVLNAVIALVTLGAERRRMAPPPWIRPVILLSIPWAVGIRIVTAFLFSGLPGRSFWLTAMLAPRFLASALAAGPALLILLCLVMRRLTRFDAGRVAVQKLAVVVACAMMANVVLVLLEVFTALYSRVPEQVEHLEYLFLGLNGDVSLAPWMWASSLLAIASLVLLLLPSMRRRESVLAATCVMVFVSIWIDKGIGLVVGGFVPSPLGAVTRYVPSVSEMLITIGIWAVGALMVTVFYKITVSVRDEVAAS